MSDLITQQMQFDAQHLNHHFVLTIKGKKGMHQFHFRIIYYAEGHRFLLNIPLIATGNAIIYPASREPSTKQKNLIINGVGDGDGDWRGAWGFCERSVSGSNASSFTKSKIMQMICQGISSMLPIFPSANWIRKK